MWLGPGALFCAAETKAPSLDEQTREGLQNLQLLQRGLVEGDTGATGKMSGVAPSPTLDHSSDGGLPQPVISEEARQTRENARREWAERNWLIDGMRKAGRPATGGSPPETAGPDPLFAVDQRAADSPEARAGAALQPGGADYWLALAVRAQEQIEHDAAAGEGPPNSPFETDRAGGAASPGPNPLAAFMSKWTRANAEGAADLTRPDATRAPMAGPSTLNDSTQSLLFGLEPGAGTTMRPAGMDPSRGQTTNPFLAAAPARDDRNPSAAPGDWPVESAVGWSAPPVVDRRPNSASAAPAAPLPSTATANESSAPTQAAEAWRPPVRDDEKYFPRLKRF